MTDLRPKLARDRDGIAIDAMGIGETYLVWFGDTYQNHQIGPFDSDAVVRISTNFCTNVMIGTDAASIEYFNMHNAYGVHPNLFHIGINQTEHIRLPKGESLHMQKDSGTLSVTIMK